MKLYVQVTLILEFIKTNFLIFEFVKMSYASTTNTISTTVLSYFCLCVILIEREVFYVTFEVVLIKNMFKLIY